MTFEIKISGDHSFAPRFQKRNVTIVLKHDGETQEFNSTLRDALSLASEFMAEKWKQENVAVTPKQEGK